MHKICIVSAMHLASNRVPRKMMQMFGDQPLCEIVLSTIQQAAKLAKVHHVAAIPEDDKELIEIAESLEVEVITRNKTSSCGESIEDAYNLWADILRSRYDYIVEINCCFPFMSVPTILKFLDKVKQTPNKPLLGVFKVRGWVWNNDFMQIVGVNDICLNTKTNEVYYVPAHYLYGSPSKTFGTNEMQKNFELVEIPKTIETTTDIDTPRDLEIAKAIWNARHSNIFEGATGISNPLQNL